jgi:glucan endo-1,3-alpha-glucosidase
MLTLLHRPGAKTLPVNVLAGIHTVSGPMGIGAQVFTLKRGITTVLSGTGAIQMSNSCTVNNFYAYVGSVKA